MVLIPPPTHGPDSERPLERFAVGNFSFRLVVMPAALPIQPMLYLYATGGLLDDILGTLYEAVGGKIALRIDPRFKVLVMRQNLSTSSSASSSGPIVGMFFAPSEEAAIALCRHTLANWADGDYADHPRMTAKEIRRAIRQSREGPTRNGE